MKLIPAALILLALLAPTIAVAQSDYDYKPVPRGWVIAGEAGAATILGYGLGVGAFLGTFYLLDPGAHGDFWDENSLIPAAASLFTATAATATGGALGAWGVGTLLHDPRQYWPAVAGSTCGIVGAVALQFVRPLIGYPAMIPVLVLSVALPPAGAVIGYNIGRPADASYGGFEQRLEMPRMVMTVTHDGLNRPVSGVRCDLVTLRF